MYHNYITVEMSWGTKCVCVYSHLMPCCVDNFVAREGESFIAQVCVQHLLKYLSTAHKE